MKTLFPILLFIALPLCGNDIFQYHKDFHFLLEQGSELQKVTETIESMTPYLNEEVEVFAAADMRMSAELLYNTSNLILHQHSALVEVFTKTQYFNEDHIRPSITILLANTRNTRIKCERYIQVVRQPQLFQQILNLKEIAQRIETKLQKYSLDQEKEKQTKATTNANTSTDNLKFRLPQHPADSGDDGNPSDTSSF